MPTVVGLALAPTLPWARRATILMPARASHTRAAPNTPACRTRLGAVGTGLCPAGERLATYSLFLGHNSSRWYGNTGWSVSRSFAKKFHKNYRNPENGANA